jgi:hypothetical protein
VEPLILYFDRCAGKRLPEAMALLKLENVKSVYHHNTPRHKIGLGGNNRKTPLFTPAEKDDTWLEFVGSRGWVVFSQDRKFHRKGFEHEMHALRHFNVGCFYLWGGSAKTPDRALVFLKAYEKILKAIQETPRPFIYDITKSGKLKRVDINEKARGRAKAKEAA